MESVESIFMASSIPGQSSSQAQSKYLDRMNIDDYIRDGITVVKGVFSEEEIQQIRSEFHTALLSKGIDVNDLDHTAHHLCEYSSTGGAGGILDIFYEDWKLKLNEHPRVVSIMQKLWAATYAPCEPGVFHHPFGPFDSQKALMYIDRVCFRVPDRLSSMFTSKGDIVADGGKKKGKSKNSLQRSLTPHLDCCPHRIFQSVKDIPKWRPIQAFIALTDTLETNHGGFEACPGFHYDIEEWAKHRRPLLPVSTASVAEEGNVSGEGATEISDSRIPCVGDFSPIRPKEDKEVIERFCPIPAAAGDMVIWDFRIPHANARSNDHPTQARECVYLGLLPHIPINEAYVRNQLQLFREGSVPRDQWHEHSKPQQCDFEFSELGKKMMTIDPW